jgi:hypothetical protein
MSVRGADILVIVISWHGRSPSTQLGMDDERNWHAATKLQRRRPVRSFVDNSGLRKAKFPNRFKAENCHLILSCLELSPETNSAGDWRQTGSKGFF